MQVLGNLLQNAARYSPEGSAIEVSLAVSAECAIFTVQDNGYGVNEEDLPRLFEKFFRSKSNQNTGLGLGLSICKAIIEVHGGTILARNVPIGRGLVIEFSLPIQKTIPSSQGVKS
jgi:signal transduction histidine kinase